MAEDRKFSKSELTSLPGIQAYVLCSRLEIGSHTYADFVLDHLNADACAAAAKRHSSTDVFAAYCRAYKHLQNLERVLAASPRAAATEPPNEPLGVEDDDFRLLPLPPGKAPPAD